MKVLYTAKATSTGGRTGHGATDDGVLDGALKAAGRKAGVKLPEDSTVTAPVSFLDREDGQGFWVKAALEVNLPGIDKTTADDLVRRAHVICPYSEVSRKDFEVTLDVV